MAIKPSEIGCLGKYLDKIDKEVSTLSCEEKQKTLIF